jgi:mannose-6-phosphate isomerase-like protein (cupin superfamily)
MTESLPAVGRPTGPFDLSKTPIHLGSLAGADTPAVPIPDFGFDGRAFGAYVAEHCSPSAPGRLIMVESTLTNWGAWECHTQGDEVVIVLEGKGVFIQQIGKEERRTPVGPGSTMINPAGVWHTADIEAPLRAIFITPIPGTQHRAR